MAKKDYEVQMKFIDAEMLKMFHTFTGDMNNKNTKDAIFLQK